jgi:glutamate-1-semialdehyde 2,1-aminomutase
MSLAFTFVEEYNSRTRRSRELAQEACASFPGGIVHDARFFRPHPIYAERAAGSRKWDVDGNEYVDYVGGHGAMLLGHAHPRVTAAAQRQLEYGTHFGACNELELRWAQLVQRMMPAAELVRFTNSGTEATLLAIRLARAFSGRPKILRFNGHFHGWHDHAAFGVASHHDGTPTPGVLKALAEQVLLCDPGDMAAVERLLAEGDVAAVILEPTGATWGQVPFAPSDLRQLRSLTKKFDTLLIFDEVVTGFRCSPGGVQALYDIAPDLTTLAKVLAGGMPGGAVTGRRDIMELLDAEACRSKGVEKIPHHGTYNANPVSAAAGIAALTIINETDACERASNFAARLRNELNRLFVQTGSTWRAYGSFSAFHIYASADDERVEPAELDSGHFDYRRIKAAAQHPLIPDLRLALRLHGVDIFGWPGGTVSSVHTDEDLEQTVEAFEASLLAIKG